MPQIKRERLTDRYCPRCRERMQWWGNKKFGMVRCIVDDCDEVIMYEDSLELELVEKNNESPLNRNEGYYDHYWKD